jgi:DNA-binding transcriptional MerR regulator
MEKLYYTITEVSKLLNIKPYVIRYWETEFPQIKKSRKSGRNRRYSIREFEVISLIKHLLYDKKYTIKGAKQALQDGIDTNQVVEKVDIPLTPQEQVKSIKKLLLDIKQIVKRYK